MWGSSNTTRATPERKALALVGANIYKNYIIFLGLFPASVGANAISAVIMGVVGRFHFDAEVENTFHRFRNKSRRPSKTFFEIFHQDGKKMLRRLFDDCSKNHGFADKK